MTVEINLWSFRPTYSADLLGRGTVVGCNDGFGESGTDPSTVHQGGDFFLLITSSP
jgi:hypothetical protein